MVGAYSSVVASINIIVSGGLTSVIRLEETFVVYGGDWIIKGTTLGDDDISLVTFSGHAGV